MFLKDARQEAGYASSRAFFNANGGRKFFGCTYRHYLNLENGRTPPGAGLLGKIILGLSLHADKSRARRFVTEYLRAVSGSQDVVDFIAGSLSAEPEKLRSARAPLVESMARRNREDRINLTREQAEFFCSTAENHWAFTILTSDSGAWDAAQIAKRTGLKAGKIQASLNALVRLKLANRSKDGKYRSPHAGKVFQVPDEKIYTVGSRQLRDFRTEMTKNRGATLFRYHFFSRASEAELRQYFPYLVKGVQGAHVLTTSSAGPDTVFFEIETSVRKVLPF